jgi:RNA polymerase primary sigma factor
MNGEDELREYLDAASKGPLLSKDEELALSAGRDGGDDKAREQLIRANMRLVVSIAHRYQGRGLSLPNIVRAGHSGLERAVDRFDQSRGYRSTTYSTWWIRQAIT